MIRQQAVHYRGGGWNLLAPPGADRPYLTKGDAMKKVFFVGTDKAIVRHGRQDTLIEQAHVVVKKVGRRWARVLVGVVRQMRVRKERVWPVELVLSLLRLGERLVVGLQAFLRGIIPGDFRLILETPKLRFALVWG